MWCVMFSEGLGGFIFGGEQAFYIKVVSLYWNIVELFLNSTQFEGRTNEKQISLVLVW